MLCNWKNLKGLEFEANVCPAGPPVRCRCVDAWEFGIHYELIGPLVPGDRPGEVQWSGSHDPQYDRVACGLLRAAYGEEFSGYKHNYWLYGTQAWEVQRFLHKSAKEMAAFALTNPAQAAKVLREVLQGALQGLSAEQVRDILHDVLVSGVQDE